MDARILRTKPVKLIYVLIACIGKRMAEIVRRFGAAKWFQFERKYSGRWVEQFLAVRPAKSHDANAVRNSLTQQIAHKGTRLADFLRRHLGVIGSVDNNAKQCLRATPPQETNGPFEPEDEFLQVVGGSCI